MGHHATQPLASFALLAPVPLDYLRSAQQKAAADGLEFVAFGSGAVTEHTSLYSLKLFRSIDEERAGRPVMLLIYPSWDEAEPKPPYLVEWTGVYTGHVTARGDGLHPAPDPWWYRPPASRANREAGRSREEWVLYWHAAGLRELAPELRIEVAALGRSRPMRPWPLGPEVIRGAAWHTIRDACHAAP